MDVLIREIHKSDRDMWLGMYRQLFPNNSDDALIAEMERIFKSGKRSAYVALIDDMSVGFAEYALRDYANGCHSQPVPFLEGIWIDADYRGQGIAKSLVSYLEQKARMAGFREFGSDVELSNYPSQLMHERLGFEQTEKVIFYRKVLD
jgi:aminoglycoside 6'-N-acetyltransferase I